MHKLIRRRFLTAATCVGATLLVAACSTQQRVDSAAAGAERAILVPGTGVYSRPISTDSKVAQQFFDQGLRLSWGFYFPEAIASYQEAARHDPDHPMIYWGMAHAMGPNPNSRYARMPDDPQGEGLKAIRHALTLLDGASDLEREMIETLYIRYDKDSIPDDGKRDRAYLDAMRVMAEKYPEDADIAALFADSYMSIGRWDYWDKNGTPKPGTIRVMLSLERALAAEPGHPGTNHLHIHLMEASLVPERALGSADRLESTMPIAGHVVHMPAHIYVRVGLYDKAIANNVRSQAVDKEFLEIWGDHPFPNLGTYPLSARIHAPHAIDFIRYAATVQGNYETAIAAARKSAASVSAETIDRRGSQKRASAPWLVHKIFGKWDELLNREPEYSGRPYLDGIRSYTVGSAYVAKGDIARAQTELANIRRVAKLPNVNEHRVGPSPVSSILSMAAYGLDGEIKQSQGDLDGAIEAFAAAVELEDENPYTEPPDWAQPLRHYLGAALLQAGRAEEAEAVYRRDLRWNQNNGWGLFGLWKSLAAQGKSSAAEAARVAYEASWQNSDVTLASSRI
jgi:tetratricopeptide (TPR) repeat protein